MSLMNTRERAHYFNYGVLFVVSVVCRSARYSVLFIIVVLVYFPTKVICFSRFWIQMNRRFEFSSRKVVVADVRRERSKSMEPFW